MKGTTDFSMFARKARDTHEQSVKCLSLPHLLDDNKMKHVGYMLGC